MATVRQDRWMQSLSSLSERDLLSMFYLSITELSYRHRCSGAAIVERFGFLPDPFVVERDAASGEDRLQLSVAGRIWQIVTGRRTARAGESVH